MSEEEPLVANRVVRRLDGSIALHLVEREREILRALLHDLASVIDAPPGAGNEWDDGEAAGARDPDAAGEPDAAHEGGSPDYPPVGDIQARLYPSAAPTDPRADASYRRLVHEDLEAGRRARIAIVESTLDAPVIDDAQAAAWLQVLNDLRLVLGTRLAVTEDAESEALDAEDPQAAARVVYAYTGWLEGQFVDVLAAALPDVAEPGEWSSGPRPDVDPDASTRRDDT